MGQRFYVITYRTNGKVFFFRGRLRYAIYLSRFPSPHWVESVAEARLFVRPPDFNPKSIPKQLDGNMISAQWHEDTISPDNIIIPTRRTPKYRHD